MALVGRFETVEEDVPYEEDILRNPFSLRSWLRYLEWKRDAPAPLRFVLYERAVASLPGSYKLWHAYLDERQQYAKQRAPTSRRWEALAAAFERALVFLHRMPRLWLDYTAVLTHMQLVTRTRQTYNRSLRALPVTQHPRIWTACLRWVRGVHSPPTAVRVYRRYLKLEPTRVEEFVEYLLQNRLFEDAAQELARVLNSGELLRALGEGGGRGKSVGGATELPASGVGGEAGKWQALYLQLADIVARHPAHVRGLRVEPMLRAGLARFPAESGRLWTGLADYFIREGHFEKARDVFEEALAAVMSVKDFSQVWDAYVQFEDSVLAAKMQAREAAGGEPDEEADRELDLLVARYERLIERRAILLSSVLLRQNPHDVREWHKRVKLMRTAAEKTETYAAALRTVDPFSSMLRGRMASLWTGFARFYESHGDVDAARRILERATSAKFRFAEDLASVWTAWAEMELRRGDVDAARRVLQQATQVPSKKAAATMPGDAQRQVHRQLRPWTMLADLEESVGTVDSTRAVYDQIIELKIATPALIAAYASYLEQHAFFEDSFRAYERGLALFQYPWALDLWLLYLSKFVQRYGGRKLERARDLFEQALEKVPAKDAKTLYLMYARLEEEHGLARHAMAVYDRAVRAVADEDRFGMFVVYALRASEFFGVTRAREVFERAIETLPERQVRDMCLRYADLERKLGEIDRARAVLVHGSQYADPKVDPEYWQRWHEFEVAHGSEDTFRDMLRTQRSVQGSYAAHVNLMGGTVAAAAAQHPLAAAAASVASTSTAASSMAAVTAAAQAATLRPMAALEELRERAARAPPAPGEEPAPKEPRSVAEMEQRARQAETGEEIELDERVEQRETHAVLDIDREREAKRMRRDTDVAAEADDAMFEQQQVPASVFGSAAAAAAAAASTTKAPAAPAVAVTKPVPVPVSTAAAPATAAPTEKLGALERLRRKK